MYFAIMVWSYEICTYIVSRSIPQENPIILFALMLFIKFVLPFYDLVACTMLFFLPISTCKVCTNKFYDIYAISKYKVCTKRTHVVCTNDFYDICPAHFQTLSLHLKVMWLHAYVTQFQKPFTMQTEGQKDVAMRKGVRQVN